MHGGAFGVTYLTLLATQALPYCPIASGQHALVGDLDCVRVASTTQEAASLVTAALAEQHTLGHSASAAVDRPTPPCFLEETCIKSDPLT